MFFILSRSLGTYQLDAFKYLSWTWIIFICFFLKNMHHHMFHELNVSLVSSLHHSSCSQVTRNAPSTMTWSWTTNPPPERHSCPTWLHPTDCCWEPWVRTPTDKDSWRHLSERPRPCCSSPRVTIRRWRVCWLLQVAFISSALFRLLGLLVLSSKQTL